MFHQLAAAAAQPNGYGNGRVLYALVGIGLLVLAGFVAGIGTMIKRVRVGWRRAHRRARHEQRRR
jgi:hypothetical protein